MEPILPSAATVLTPLEFLQEWMFSSRGKKQAIITEKYFLKKKECSAGEDQDTDIDVDIVKYFFYSSFQNKGQRRSLNKVT